MILNAFDLAPLTFYLTGWSFTAAKSYNIIVYLPSGMDPSFFFHTMLGDGSPEA